MSDKTARIISRVIAGIILVVFLYSLLVEPKVCDGHVCFYYMVHPFSIADILGLIIFLAGFYVLIFGGKPFIGDIYMRPHSLNAVFITMGVILAGLGIMWLL